MPSAVICAAASIPALPCPSMIHGSSKLGTSVAPRASASLAAIVSRLSVARS
jgi:hypothetical protein